MTNYELWQLSRYGNIVEANEPEDTEEEVDNRMPEFFEREILEHGID